MQDQYWSQFFRLSELKIQNFGNHGATFGIYWVYYKPPVLSYSEVGTYDLYIELTLIKQFDHLMTMECMEYVERYGMQ